MFGPLRMALFLWSVTVAECSGFDCQSCLRSWITAAGFFDLNM